IPAAIHVTPEAAAGGPLALVRDGDRIRLDCDLGTLELLVDAAELAGPRPQDGPAPDPEWAGMGRALVARLRRPVGRADEGASIFGAGLPAVAQPAAAVPAAAQPAVAPTRDLGRVA